MAAPKLIVLDSSPLGLLVHRNRGPQPDQCRLWAAQHIANGSRFIIPEIVDYELRRELLRLKVLKSVGALDIFLAATTDRFLPLTTSHLRLAAKLWAQARGQGKPTADPHALDVDVILAAQILIAGYDPADFVVATSNVKHLSQFVPAQLWFTI